jgi:glutaredoxin
MSGHHHPLIEIFSTPTCPDCRALKAWLESQGIPFIERDLRDPAIAEEAKRRTGVCAWRRSPSSAERCSTEPSRNRSP